MPVSDAPKRPGSFVTRPVGVRGARYVVRAHLRIREPMVQRSGIAWDSCVVIPTALLLGLIIGRAWAVPTVALVWTVLLLVTGTLAAADIPSAAALGAANAFVGVLVHRWMLGVARRTHHAR